MRDMQKELIKKYEGKRVELIEMKDDNGIVSGEKGKVVKVDGMGTLHVNWDNGRNLGLILEEDEFKVID